jgi:tetratricopeptide (TPR) repeat protein
MSDQFGEWIIVPVGDLPKLACTMARPLRFRCISLVAAVSVASGPVCAQGIYGPVELKGKEPHDLIETASQFHDQFERRSVLYNGAAALELVRKVGYDLAPPETDDYYAYEFYLIRDPSPNAFAMPNGRIYVHTGMLARLEDSSQLAALMGHEITHVAGHHSIVQFRIKAGQVLDWVFTGGLITLFTQLKFSRELEQESDDRAPAMALAAGYDPHAVPELMELLNEDFEGVRPRISTVWTTHPDPEDRLAKSLALVADMPTRPRDPDTFDSVVHPLRIMTVEDYINDDFPYTAIATAQSFAERYPDDLNFQVLLGDAWRQLGPRDEFAPDDFTNRDKRRNLRRRAFRTRTERINELLETPEGQAAYAANLARSEEIFQEVIARDPTFAPAYRGLGETYEALDRPRDAGRAYLEYVRQAPDADDRTVIMSRLTTIRDRLAEENANGSQ